MTDITEDQEREVQRILNQMKGSVNNETWYVRQLASECVKELLEERKTTAKDLTGVENLNLNLEFDLKRVTAEVNRLRGLMSMTAAMGPSSPGVVIGGVRGFEVADPSALPVGTVVLRSNIAYTKTGQRKYTASGIEDGKNMFYMATEDSLFTNNDVTGEKAATLLWKPEPEA